MPRGWRREASKEPYKLMPSRLCVCKHSNCAHENAIKYLDSLKNSHIKNPTKIEELKGYIRRKSPNMTCYALRHELGLRISSNRVEKANDLVVAARQKHNGMSWSRKGSGALAIITTTMINGEMEAWMTGHTIN